MNFLKKLDNDLLTALFVVGVSIIGFCSTAFLISSTYIDIPLGFLLSGGILTLIHILSFFLKRIDSKKDTTAFTIVAITLRLVLLIASLMIITFMYYRWGIKLFNVFVFVGMYTASIIIYMLTYIFYK